MPTDDERREVARRLRGAKYGRHSWERALYDALGVDTETAGLDMLESLADLIEPSCDRDALLALADGLEYRANELIKAAQHARFSGLGPTMERAKHDAYELRIIARRIREALGVVA